MIDDTKENRSGWSFYETQAAEILMRLQKFNEIRASSILNVRQGCSLTSNFRLLTRQTSNAGLEMGMGTGMGPEWQVLTRMGM